MLDYRGKVLVHILELGKELTNANAGARRDLLGRGHIVTVLDTFDGSIKHGFSASLTPEMMTVI